MPELGHHVILRTLDDRPLATTPREHRALAAVFLEVGKDHGLFAFGAADTHAHAGLACDRASAGRFAQRVACALRQRLDLGVGFERARILPFRDQWHRASSVPYILGQARRHGVTTDPFLETSALPDLLGLRPAGLYLVPHARAVLPRVTRKDLLAQLGVAEVTEHVDLAHLREGACAAALLPDLHCRSVEAVEARRAAVAAAPDAESGALADALALPLRTIQWLRAAPASPALVRAIRLQMGLRASSPAPNPAVREPPALAWLARVTGGGSCGYGTHPSQHSGTSPAPEQAARTAGTTIVSV